MRFTQIRDFLAVAENHSIRAAARELGIAQPSLTKSIMALEKELKASLFDRSSRGATVTPAGAAFQERARLIMEEARRAKDEVSQLTGGNGGDVGFGISTAPIIMFLAKTMTEFQRRFPAVNVRIVNGIFPVAIPELRSGRLDFAIVPRPDNDIDDEFAVECLLRNSRVPVCRNTHPLARSTSLAELTSATWLAASIDPKPRAAFEAIFRHYGLAAPEHVIACETTIAMCELLAHMDTICWLPHAWLESELMKPWLTTIPIMEPRLEGQDICLIQRRNFPLTPAADYLATLIRRHCAYRADTSFA